MDPAPPPSPSPLLTHPSRGYNTAAERAAAASTPGIRLLSLRGFRELRPFGLAMGGAEGWGPTAGGGGGGVGGGG